MKTILASILALGLLAGQASAKNLFDNIQDSAPHSQTLNDSTSRSTFGDLQDSAPRSLYGDLQDSAPRSDGVYGTLENNAP